MTDLLDLPDPEFGPDEPWGLISKGSNTLRRIVDWNGDPARWEGGLHYRGIRMADLPEGVEMGWRYLGENPVEGLWLPPEDDAVSA